MLFAVSVGFLVIGLLGLVWWWNIRPRVLEVRGLLPVDFPAEGFSHETFESLLRRFVSADGAVDYAAWHADTDAGSQLDSYLVAVARFSPENAPARFAGKGDALVYWVHAYNAFVIRSVLERWPLDSVTDVKAPLEVVRGLGFFYTLEFVAGGKRYNLYDLEHERALGDTGDARVHFVLNCASGSCPPIRPELPTGDALEPFLERVAREFVADPANVEVNHEAHEIRLSRIFEWYEDDFLNDLRRRGLPPERGIVDYLVTVAPDPLRDALQRAAGYEVVYREYDWSLNEATDDAN